MRALPAPAIAFLTALILATGCTPPTPETGALLPTTPNIPRTPAGIPIVRVRLLENQTVVRVTATASPTYSVNREPPGTLQIGGRPGGISVSLLSAQGGQGGQGGWNLGGVGVNRAGALALTPASPGSLAINNVPYRGGFRFVPVGAGRFDVVNEVEIDDYLCSVISKELLSSWHPETFRAQAVVARTYALHEIATSRESRFWDVYDDERSQVYGGLPAETTKSLAAVNATRGIVVAYGPAGKEKIFKAYFSACCGGIGQTPQDAFGDPLFPPLGEKNVGTLCSASPRFTWGPFALAKAEVTRRIKTWGARKNRPEANLTTITTITDAQNNRLGRPVRFLVTDTRGARYAITAEELRNALNIDARTVFSSYILVRDQGASIAFAGHGSGHGVGMCQYCAQALALRGESHENIVRFSYPGAVLIRAY